MRPEKQGSISRWVARDDQGTGGAKTNWAEAERTLTEASGRMTARWLG